MRIIVAIAMLLCTAAASLAFVSGPTGFMLGVAVSSSSSGGKNWKSEFDSCRSAIAAALPEEYDAADATRPIAIGNTDLRWLLKQCRLPYEMIPLTVEQAAEIREKEERSILITGGIITLVLTLLFAFIAFVAHDESRAFWWMFWSVLSVLMAVLSFLSWNALLSM